MLVPTMRQAGLSAGTEDPEQGLGVRGVARSLPAEKPRAAPQGVLLA